MGRRRPPTDVSPKRALRLAAAPLLAAVAALSAPAAAQTSGDSAPAPSAAADAAAPPSLSEPTRFSDGDFRLRGSDDALDRDEGALREPLDRARPTPSIGADQRLDRPAPPEGDDAARRAAPGVDLFAGPAPVAPRRNVAEGEAEPAGTAAGAANRTQNRASGRTSTRAGSPAEDPLAVDLPLLRRFDPVGPVRSPVLDDVAANRRLTGALDGLRAALPRTGDDPFAPVGLRLGSFILYPALEQTLGGSTNLTNTLDGEEGPLSQTTLSGRLVSDWSRHAAEINAQATYRRNFEGPVEDEPAIDVDGRLRLDIGRATTATLRGALSLRQDDAIVTGAADLARDRSEILAYSLGADLSRAVGRATGTASVEAVREDRDDSPFALSESASLLGSASLVEPAAVPVREPNASFTTYTGALRAGYDMGAAFKPFATVSLGRRVFDEDLPGDLSRDTVIPALRAGFGFDFGEKLAGEVGLGYAWNVPDRDAAPTTSSPTVDALLAWSPRRGTDVSFRAATFFEPDAAGLDTATLYQTTLGVRHRATARLDLEGAGQLAWRARDLTGTERIRSGELGVVWWVNRQLALLARYRHDRFEGVLTDYDADTIRVGLRVQR